MIGSHCTITIQITEIGRKYIAFVPWSKKCSWQKQLISLGFTHKVLVRASNATISLCYNILLVGLKGLKSKILFSDSIVICLHFSEH